MSNPWFRLYTETVDDEKLRLLAFEDRWHFIAILCCKGKGILDEPNQNLARRKVAVKLGLDLPTLDEVARRLAEVGLIDAKTLQPLAWNRRQFTSDQDPTRNERKRRYREKQKDEGGNGSGTHEERTRNGSGTHGERPPEADADTDTDKPLEKAVGDSPGARPKPSGGAPPRSRKAVKSSPVLTPLPAVFAITPELQAWADQRGYSEPLSQHLDAFKDKALAKNYQYADWNAAFRRAVREDWAGLRNGAPTATGAPGGRRKGQTMIEHMMESHARMDALLDAKDAENRAAHALSAETAPLQDVPYVRH